MKLRFACLSLLTILVVITFIHLSACEVMADKAGVASYDSSKFEPITMTLVIPLFNVIDQRPSKQIFFNIKREMIPPIDYFRDGIQDFIAQSSTTIQDDGRELKFIIKDFRVVFEKKYKQMGSGELRSTMEVDVLINDNGKSFDIGNYKDFYYNNVNREISSMKGISTQDIQNVIDHNFHKLLEKIFTDKSFVGVVKKDN